MVDKIFKDRLFTVLGDKMNEDKVIEIVDKYFQQQGFTTRKNAVAFKTAYEELKGKKEELIKGEEKVRIYPFIPYRLTRVDIIAKRGDTDIWIIEAKGNYDVKNPKTYTNSFEVAIAQLLKSMVKIGKRFHYAIAIPFSRTERHERFSYELILCKYTKSKFFKILNVHLILVRDDETVKIIPPKDVNSFLESYSKEHKGIQIRFSRRFKHKSPVDELDLAN